MEREEAGVKVGPGMSAEGTCGCEGAGSQREVMGGFLGAWFQQWGCTSS